MFTISIMNGYIQFILIIENKNSVNQNIITNHKRRFFVIKECQNISYLTENKILNIEIFTHKNTCNNTKKTCNILRFFYLSPHYMKRKLTMNIGFIGTQKGVKVILKNY